MVPGSISSTNKHVYFMVSKAAMLLVKKQIINRCIALLLI